MSAALNSRRSVALCTKTDSPTSSKKIWRQGFPLPPFVYLSSAEERAQRFIIGIGYRGQRRAHRLGAVGNLQHVCVPAAGGVVADVRRGIATDPTIRIALLAVQEQLVQTSYNGYYALEYGVPEDDSDNIDLALRLIEQWI